MNPVTDLSDEDRVKLLSIAIIIRTKMEDLKMTYQALDIAENELNIINSQLELFMKNINIDRLVDMKT